MDGFGLYTYQAKADGSGEECHIYLGARDADGGFQPLDQTVAQDAGQQLKDRAATASQPPLGFMVLPAELLPTGLGSQ